VDMTADVPEIIDVERYGSCGWSFWAQWRSGTPSEFKRKYRTSTSGHGLLAFYGFSGWVPCRWLAHDYLWPRDRAGFEKRARNLMRSGNYPTHKL
jgi:hypothetical protein